MKNIENGYSIRRVNSQKLLKCLVILSFVQVLGKQKTTLRDLIERDGHICKLAQLCSYAMNSVCEMQVYMCGHPCLKMSRSNDYLLHLLVMMLYTATTRLKSKLK